MRQVSVQHRTGRSSGKGASAYRSAFRRPRAARRPVTRRRPLFFYALTASVAGGLAAVVFDMQVLVLLFSLTGLFLCAVFFRTAKT
jgi:hypothetical protein